MKTSANNSYGNVLTSPPQSSAGLDINTNTNSSKANLTNSAQSNSRINSSFSSYDYQKSDISPANSCQESTISSTASSSSSFDTKPSQSTYTSYPTQSNFLTPVNNSINPKVNQENNYFRQYSAAVYGYWFFFAIREKKLYYFKYAFLLKISTGIFPSQHLTLKHSNIVTHCQRAKTKANPGK